MLTKTTAQKKIAQLKKRIRIIQGGTSSSKTFTILTFLIQYAIDNPNSEISVVAESIPHIKRGALKDFIKIMRWIGNFNEGNFNQSSLPFRFILRCSSYNFLAACHEFSYVHPSRLVISCV